ncbi:MAG TPA: hypothetical protein VK020_04035 [Microlunatus sp.]|nr:hypothetical protein [Microlunatus sp.]
MIDGKLFGLVRKPREFSYGSLWIRADWLQRLGLAEPTTLEEFRDVLRAFRGADPDGNGKKDTVGLTGSGLAAFDPIFGAFGIAGPGSIYADGDKIVDGYNDPRVRQPLAFIRSLFDEQLVDPDLFGLKTAEARDRAFQGSAGAIMIGWDQMTKPEFVRAQQAAQPDSDWQPIDVLDGPHGAGAMPTSPFGAVQGIPAALADDEERLNALLDYVNHICTPEGSRLVMFGLEGSHYELDGDTVVPLPAMDEDGAYFFAYQVAGRDENLYLEVKFPKQKTAWQGARDRKRVTQYESLVTPPDGFNTADADRFGKEQIVLFLTGERSLDTYPDFLEQLNGQFDFAGYTESAREQLAALGHPR